MHSTCFYWSVSWGRGILVACCFAGKDWEISETPGVWKVSASNVRESLGLESSCSSWTVKLLFRHTHTCQENCCVLTVWPKNK